jgi:hypothetical protein
MKIDDTRKLPEHVETLVFYPRRKIASLEGLANFVDEEHQSRNWNPSSKPRTLATAMVR